MRGDRPELLPSKGWYYVFTPHARGSTMPKDKEQAVAKVYPACAGIDPTPQRARFCAGRLPRMRGDRPGSSWSAEWDGGFTPHARGSTVDWEFAVWNGAVYPACAGIDPEIGWRGCVVRSLPRMRGDRPGHETHILPYSTFTPHARGSTYLCPAYSKMPEVYPACAGIDRADLSAVP